MKEKYSTIVLTNKSSTIYNDLSVFDFVTIEKENVPEGIRQLEHFCKNIKEPNAIILNCQLFTKLSTD